MRHTILVVEDDHALRDVLLRGLRDEGFDTVPAPDGATALRLAGDDVDAAVLDVGLPDADGRDVCQAIRANGFLSPVIFLTAHHHLTDRLAGFGRRRRLSAQAVPPDGAGRPAAGGAQAQRTAPGHHGRGPGPGPRRAQPHRPGHPGRPHPDGVPAAGGADGGVRGHRSQAGAGQGGWPEGAHVSDNTLDQYLTRLRRKLRDGGSTLTITTARGIGHRLS